MTQALQAGLAAEQRVATDRASELRRRVRATICCVTTCSADEADCATNIVMSLFADHGRHGEQMQ